MHTTINPTPYPDQFKAIILRGAHQALECVQQSEGPLTGIDEEQTLHTLDYSLRVSDTWPVTRDVLTLLAPKMEQAGYRDDWYPFLGGGSF
ncbi:hypothetical protein KFU94_39820 [Chloroflexi bacterium TSY]|nr:hypothetical protein [Chloroflexi bacterium TSY]